MKTSSNLRCVFAASVAATMLASCTVLRQAQDDTQPPVAAPNANAQGLAKTSETFKYTGKKQTFTVPVGVKQVSVVVSGAIGPSGDGYVGGNGGMVKATIPVTPGEKLAVFVGGEGGAAGYGVAGQAGFNGGGAGGGVSKYAIGGCGGGGASDIRQGGNRLEDRIVIAAGGGGGGVDQSFYGGGFGGDGGGGIGSAGGSGNPGSAEGEGGQGGSQTKGGAGGSGGTRGSGYHQGSPGKDGRRGSGGGGGG
ncbi:MAG: glycine-rich protein, partial [Candidatus Cybelea sp.]